MNSDPKTRSRQELLKRGVVITVAVIIGFLIGVYLLGIIELSNMGGAPLICAEPMYKKWRQSLDEQDRPKIPIEVSERVYNKLEGLLEETPVVGLPMNDIILMLIQQYEKKA